MSRRSVRLDWLRLTAVVAVVCYHVVQQSPLSHTAIVGLTQYGRYGVDLFFALSGWLIGSLFWREHARFGDVELWRFWCRRALRTIPPYIDALLASWFAVAITRSEPFDAGYLIFIQNYYQRMPFFLVSWSLCVEEQFYVAAPLTSALIAHQLSARRLPWIYLGLLAVSPILRLLQHSESVNEEFGYGTTATHLHMDGLVAGFGLSCTASTNPKLLATLLAWRARAVAAIGAAIVLLGQSPSVLQFMLMPSALAVLFCLLIVSPHETARSLAPASAGEASIVKTIAMSAYSAYLMHPLAIHAALALTARLGPSAGDIGYWPLVIASVLISTLAFWAMIERPSMWLRDRLVPAR